MTWWLWALTAALVWGFHYNIVAKSLTVASPITVYFLPNILLMLALPWWYQTLVKDYHSIMAASVEIKSSIVVVMFTSIIASVAVYKAIHGSNATLASLIEISYPVFVALFAIIVFKENHLDWSTVLGGLLILTGTALIIYKHG